MNGSALWILMALYRVAGLCRPMWRYMYVRDEKRLLCRSFWRGFGRTINITALTASSCTRHLVCTWTLNSTGAILFITSYQHRSEWMRSLDKGSHSVLWHQTNVRWPVQPAASLLSLASATSSIPPITTSSDRRDAAGCTSHKVVIGEMQLVAPATW